MLEEFDRPLETRRMTAEEVFAVLAERGKPWSSTKGLPCAGYTFDELTLETSLEDYYETCGVEWYDPDDEFHITVNGRQLVKARTLGDLCRLISDRATVPVVRPARIDGRLSASGGAYLTIRAIAKEAGIDVGRLTPETLLTAVDPWRLQYLAYEVRKIIPNNLGHARGQFARHRYRALVAYDVFSVVFTAIVLLVVVAYGAPAYVIALIVPVLLIVFHGKDYWCREYFEIEGIETFGDLARALAPGASES